jgi:hypothetical protein
MKTGKVIVIGVVATAVAYAAYKAYQSSQRVIDNGQLTVDNKNAPMPNSPMPVISRAIDTPVILKYSEPVVLKQANPVRSILTTTQPVVEVPKYSTPVIQTQAAMPITQTVELPAVNYTMPVYKPATVIASTPVKQVRTSGGGGSYDLTIADQPRLMGLSRLLR